jgi:hypothetical protein
MRKAKSISTKPAIETVLDDPEFLETKERCRQQEISSFADNLETARSMFRAHPGLVKAATFPEPYRSAIRAEWDYDPQTEKGGLDDLHVTDPAKAEQKWSEQARESMLRRKKNGEIPAATPDSANSTAAAQAAEPVLEQRSEFLIGCDSDERAYAVRLIRLLRDNYWMAELVRQILDQESKTRWNWTIKSLKELLDNFSTIEALADNARRLGNNWSNHPILRAVREQWGDDEIADYQGERRIQRLIESAHKK